jgi:hypothetical protein
MYKASSVCVVVTSRCLATDPLFPFSRAGDSLTTNFLIEVEIEINLRPTVSLSRFRLPSIWRLRISWCEVSSLTREWVCNFLVQLLLGRASHFRAQVPRNSWLYFTASSQTPPTWRARFPYLYPLGTGWPVIPPGTGFPFRRLLWLGGLRWGYYSALPRGND